MADFCTQASKDSPQNVTYALLRIRPTALLWQALCESGGVTTADYDEGPSTALGRDFHSYGRFQVNEVVAGSLYNARGLLGSTLAGQIPAPPADPKPLGSWAAALQNDPYGMLYGLVVAGIFDQAMALWFPATRTDPSNPLVASPSLTGKDGSDAATLAVRVNQLAIGSAIPPGHIAMRLFWGGSSLSGMLAYSQTWAKVMPTAQYFNGVGRTQYAFALGFLGCLNLGPPIHPPIPGPPPPPAPGPTPPSPGPTPPAPSPTPPGPTPPQPLTVLEQAANAMNNALNAHGYWVGDVPVYRGFQTAAGLSPVDGFPGSHTISTLMGVLAQNNVLPSPNINPHYTFAKATGWDGVHAPTWAQWQAGTNPGGGLPSSSSAQYSTARGQGMPHT